MKQSATLLLLLFQVYYSSFAQNIYDARQSVMLQASVQENPPQISLSWVADTANGGYTIWRKAKSDLAWVDSLVTLGPTATTWTDNSIVVGQGYEYQVLKSLPAFPYGNGTPNFGAGYIYAGIKLPPTHFRGACLIVIDSSFKQTLSIEISRLLSDIEADGWSVKALFVDKNDPVTAVKASIQAWASNHPGVQRSLFLLGRVPVPYAGVIAPDIHNDHRGAWPSDGYYGCLEGVWTDQTANITSAPGTRNDNIPGDGKFDNSFFPAPLSLQVGRVDFSNMNKFPESEEALLRRYLNKDHAWRTGKMPMMERALVDNNFPADLDGFGEAGWKNFTPMFGISNVKDLQYRQTLSNQSYMWSYGCGGGGPESASDISSTTNFTTDSLQTAFTMIFGSYFGDWDYPNDFLRAAIASRSCLASTWGNRPVWFLHHMALGEPIGYSAQITMSNTGLYTPRYYGIMVHSALMGDPTLRMHMMNTVKNLNISQAGLHIKLNWEDPAQALGYFIYKKTSADSVYQLLNQAPIANTTFTDSCAGSGNISYMVRSVALRSSASGTYYNLSTGVTSTIQSDPSPFYATADFNPLLFFEELSGTNTSLNAQSYQWNFGDGTQSTEEHPDHFYAQPGTYSICLSAFDGCYSDTICKEINIVSSLPQVTANVEDATCFGSADGKIQLLATGGAPGLQYTWSNLPDTGSLVQQLLPSDYSCTITSPTGTSAVYGPYTVNQPVAWTIDAQVMMADPGQSNGSIALNLQGACTPNSFNWDTGDTTAQIEGLNPGTYCATITDCQACSQIYCTTIEQSSSVKLLPYLSSFRLFPNPVKDELLLEINLESHEALQMDILDALGRIMTSKTSQGKSKSIKWDVQTLSPGIYWLRIQNLQGAGLIQFTKS